MMLSLPGATTTEKMHVGRCGRFASNEHSNIHKYCIELLAKPPHNVAERLTSGICSQMAVKQNYLRKVVENIFLAWQVLPFRGNWVSDGC